MSDSINSMLQEEEESQIDLTPMLDVVFIMLIFFIVTSLDTMVEYFVDFHLFGVDSVLFHCAFVFEC